MSRWKRLPQRIFHAWPGVRSHPLLLQFSSKLNARGGRAGLWAARARAGRGGSGRGRDAGGGGARASAEAPAAFSPVPAGPRRLAELSARLRPSGRAAVSALLAVRTGGCRRRRGRRSRGALGPGGGRPARAPEDDVGDPGTAVPRGPSSWKEVKGRLLRTPPPRPRLSGSASRRRSQELGARDLSAAPLVPPVT